MHTCAPQAAHTRAGMQGTLLLEGMHMRTHISAAHQCCTCASRPAAASHAGPPLWPASLTWQQLLWCCRVTFCSTHTCTQSPCPDTRAHTLCVHAPVQSVPTGHTLCVHAPVQPVPTGHTLCVHAPVQSVPTGHTLCVHAPVQSVPTGHTLCVHAPVQSVPTGHTHSTVRARRHGAQKQAGQPKPAQAPNQLWRPSARMSLRAKTPLASRVASQLILEGYTQTVARLL